VASVYYNLSAQLRQNLIQINLLRDHIAAHTLPPPVLIHQRWQTQVDRVWSWHTLLGNPLKRSDIERLLTQGGHKTISKLPQVLSTIYWDWLGSSRQVTFGSIQTLADTLRMSIPNSTQAKEVIAYLQSENINPVAQAAIAHLTLRETVLGFVVPLVYLYRAGFDLQGLVNPESVFIKDKIEYYRQLRSSKSNVTLWLEYYSHKFLDHLNDISLQIKVPTLQSVSSVSKITDRQKKILNRLSDPSISITNRVIQNIFKISQITASRDLAQLAHLGLVIPQGKGRSIKYRRIL
jgi:hypothetical protein